MSWPQWPMNSATGGWPQAAVMGQATGQTMAAPATPGTTYTPEQWAAMQQQNWQQWMQWQQQYQQWQQQYGEQYQKSMSALTGQAVTLPPLPVQPPLPPPGSSDTKTAPPPPDGKPPLPPDEPPKPTAMATNLTPATTFMPSINYNMPPPTNMYMGMAQPPPNMFGTPPPTASVPGAAVAFPGNYSAFPPPNLSSMPPPAANKTDYTGNNSSSNQNNYSNKNFEGNQNWNRAGSNKNFPNNFNQPTNRTATGNRPNFQNDKRPTDSQYSDDSKKPKWDQSQQTKQNDAVKKDKKKQIDDLIEAEKNFDKQFVEWEAQFNKWKDQNAEHPDKEQYKQYEAKWENWRNQLLERREQMRKKRLTLLGQTGQEPKPETKSEETKSDKEDIKEEIENISPGNIEEDDLGWSENNTETESERPLSSPPKEQRTNVRQRGGSKSEPEDSGDDFLKSSSLKSSGGIPGLDLVEDEAKNQEESKNEPENKGPDFEAISKGINTILGDDKLMSMLSNIKNIQTKATETLPDIPKNEDSQQSDTQQSWESGNKPSLLDNPSMNNFQLQNKPPSLLGLPPIRPPFDNFAFNQRGNRPQAPNFNQNRPNFNQPSPNFNQGGSNFNQSTSNFNQSGSNFNQTNSSFNQPGSNFNQNFNRNQNFGPPVTNFGPNRFQSPRVSGGTNGPGGLGQNRSNNFNNRENFLAERGQGVNQSNLPQGPGPEDGCDSQGNKQGYFDDNSNNGNNKTNQGNFNENRPQTQNFDANRFQGSNFDVNRSEGSNFEGNQNQNQNQNFDGNRSQGSNFEGNRLQGSNLEGNCSNFEGNRSQVPNLDGNRSQGSNFDGNRSQGSNSQVSNLEGNRSQGQSFDGNRLQGPNFEGNRSQGQSLDENRPQGPNFDGNRSQGPNFDGNRPQGPNFDGNRPQGPNFDGNRSQGPNFDGNRSQGSNFDGNRSQGSNFDGNRSQGPNFDGNRNFNNNNFQGGQNFNQNFHRGSDMDDPFNPEDKFGNFGPNRPSNRDFGPSLGSNFDYNHGGPNQGPQGGKSQSRWGPNQGNFINKPNYDEEEEDENIEDMDDPFPDLPEEQRDKHGGFDSRMGQNWGSAGQHSRPQSGPQCGQQSGPRSNTQGGSDPMNRPMYPNDGPLKNNPVATPPTTGSVFDKYSEWDDALILKPATVIDYDHKPLHKEEFMEPVQTFDYCHSSTNVDKSLKEQWIPPARSYRPTYERYNEPLQKIRSREYRNFDDSGIKYAKHYDDRKYHERDNERRERNESRDRNISRERDSFRDDRRRDNKLKFDRGNEGVNKRGSEKLFADEVENISDDNDDVEDKFVKEVKVEESKTDNKPLVVTLIEDLLSPPGRDKRPPRLVIIMRGPPGSGKTFLAKLIKDKEVEQGGSAPRILSLDDYFMVESEEEVVEEGRKIMKKKMVYEYEESMEAAYRQSLEKAFKKTITDGYFPFIILDCVNDKVKHFNEMWSFGKQNGFQVYVCQMDLDLTTCTRRNTHFRSEIEIEALIKGWEATPSHFLTLDTTSLLQAASIPEVEMEEVSTPTNEEKDDSQEGQACISKWEKMEHTDDQLARLDGINKPLRHSQTTMEDYLQLEEEPTVTEAKPGEKRVRWADLEEKRRQDKIRAIGFVVGQTDWNRMMDPTQGGSALTQTKYIERVRRY